MAFKSEQRVLGGNAAAGRVAVSEQQRRQRAGGGGSGVDDDERGSSIQPKTQSWKRVICEDRVVLVRINEQSRNVAGSA